MTLYDLDFMKDSNEKVSPRFEEKVNLWSVECF
jgi:hypothetical protein